jgi:hypothetical protein
MAEVAANIERIYPEEMAADEYVFTTDTIPPRYATVVEREDGYWTVYGPHGKEKLGVDLAHWNDGAPGVQLTEGEQEIVASDDVGYNVEELEVRITGNYPEGRDRVALNLARLLLGA